MGDRANIEVREGDESVYLYTHWRGSDAPQTLQKALRRGKDRWTDNGYLARIIFCDLVSGYEDELTGFGIYASPLFASKHLLVDVTKQTVTIDDGVSVSFEQYSDPSHIPEPPEEEIDEDEEDASPPEEDASAAESMASADPRHAELNAKAARLLVKYEFSEFRDYYDREAEGFLWKITRDLSDALRSTLPAIEPPPDETLSWERLTWQERAYSERFFPMTTNTPITRMMVERHWSIKRVHHHLVSLLRDLIALDPDELGEFDLVFPAEKATRVRKGEENAIDLISSERHRLQMSSADGHMLRYGLYLGLKAAISLRLTSAAPEKLSDLIASELGLNDPLDRPERQLNPRIVEEIERIRKDRDETSASTGELT